MNKPKSRRVRKRLCATSAEPGCAMESDEEPQSRKATLRYQSPDVVALEGEDGGEEHDQGFGGE